MGTCYVCLPERERERERDEVGKGQEKPLNYMYIQFESV